MKINQFFKKKPYVIAGPCSAENEKQMLNIAHQIKNHTDVFRAGVWKPRTNPNSFEGVGDSALKWLNKVKSETGLRVITEVATARHVEACLKNDIDMLWIGARTTVNPFYVQEIANALKGVDIPVFIKNPIHPEIGLWIGAFERIYNSGLTQLIAIHRGFYNYTNSPFRNDPKWEMPIKLREKIRDLPIICDPSHISGNSSLIEDVSQTALDLNFDGLMIETHNNPSLALSDKNQQILPKKLITILKNLIVKESKLRDEVFKRDLLKHRAKIDLLDEKLIHLLNNRQEIVEIIAKFKDKNKLTIFQVERWFEILKTRKELSSKMDLNPQMIEDIFELIHKYAILTQTKIMR
tara:strand:- start:5578 stop:6630 length:1053 start_codon:yes stop_codon:yes gene_type:complete